MKNPPNILRILGGFCGKLLKIKRDITNNIKDIDF